MYSILYLRKHVFATADTEHKFSASISNSKAFKYLPLDVYYTWSELFTFAKQLSKEYSDHGKHYVPSWIDDNTCLCIADSRNHVTSQEAQKATPPVFDVDLYSGIISIGDDRLPLAGTTV